MKIGSVSIGNPIGFCPYLQGHFIGNHLMLTIQSLDERRQDGHGRVVSHGFHTRVAPQAPSDEEHGTPHQRHITLIFSRLNDLTQTVKCRVTQVSAHQVAHDPPGFLAMGRHIDHPTQRANERGEGLLGDVAKAHDGEEALPKKN